MLKKKLLLRVLVLILLYLSNFYLAKIAVQYLFETLKSSSYQIISLDIGASFLSIAMMAFYFLFLETIPYFVYLYFKHNDVFYDHEKEIIRWCLLTIPLGFIGSLFSFSIVKDMIIPFFLTFSKYLGIEEAIGFVQIVNLTLTMAILFFLIFQLPLVIKFLTAIGVISKNDLKNKNIRLTVLVVVCIVSAWITPSDIISMLLVALPIYATYEIGILISSDDSNFKECSLEEILC